MSDTLENGTVGLFHYTLKDSDGNIIDSSDGKDPMVYLHGAGNIIPGLEKHLAGKGAGAVLDVVIPAAEAYGEDSGEPPQAIPRDQFPADIPLQKGMGLRAQDAQGTPIMIFITEITESHVMVTPEHPLAGKDLHFHVEVVRVRVASEDEVAHGHPHGPDGNAGH